MQKIKGLFNYHKISWIEIVSYTIAFAIMFAMSKSQILSIIAKYIGMFIGSIFILTIVEWVIRVIIQEIRKIFNYD